MCLSAINYGRCNLVFDLSLCRCYHNKSGMTFYGMQNILYVTVHNPYHMYLDICVNLFLQIPLHVSSFKRVFIADIFCACSWRCFVHWIPVSFNIRTKNECIFLRAAAHCTDLSGRVISGLTVLVAKISFVGCVCGVLVYAWLLLDYLISLLICT